MRKFNVVLILVFAYIQLAECTWKIQRKASALGDTLHGHNLNCTKYGASYFPKTRQSCYCGMKTFYTDRNNVSKCFTGIGQRELGCYLYVDQPKKVYTIHRSSVIVAILSTKGTCYSGFNKHSIQMWENDQWIKFDFHNDIFLPRKRHIPQSNGITTTETDLLITTLNATETKAMEGTLVKINYNDCGRSTCLLLKFAGTRPWNPLEAQTTKPQTTTTTTTTRPTTTTSTTTAIPTTTTTITTMPTTTMTTTTTMPTTTTTTTTTIPTTTITTTTTIPTTTKTTTTTSAPKTAQTKTTVADVPLDPPNDKSTLKIEDEHGDDNSSLLLVVVIAFSCIILILIVVVVICCRRRRFSDKKEEEKEKSGVKVNPHASAETQRYPESLPPSYRSKASVYGLRPALNRTYLFHDEYFGEEMTKKPRPPSYDHLSRMSLGKPSTPI
ncbi:uncharacterized protein LOC130626073 [Hydractinia symbiolongicarpus]|uniref:uncharacterized protein LOC130626073 n=1 Tax=Hydractinia symbiolongicarpus TaxID=13093 RepID=UPI0025504F36|nr:uncharacterized protein LOC130626073 [Hydractinia symbiolongicarpus]